ncbi:MAG: hypothetical protein CL944_02465 [Candidatus Diapherotrites archaeon]|uniref:TRAM domain-containing protein n=1 Tax=Candidatus Iainarchaeum sp. TaxID=3101447 RepID=A0A2D6LQ35_9ARCH|nr:hypothetical protein [Candidatus Diapherotrites archaeon]|tara:strand:- start:21525 stop:21926 length:402 start_codon:yes stop_codon:yes gene_type:complete
MNEKRGKFGAIPVKEGDIYDVEIEGIGEKGDGIARVNNYVIIVPNVQKGDKVKIKINAVRGKVSFGEVIGDSDAADGEAETQENQEESEEPQAETEEADAEETNEDAEEETEDIQKEDSAETEESPEEEKKEE